MKFIPLIIFLIHFSLNSQNNELKNIINSNLEPSQKTQKIDLLINNNLHNDSLFYIKVHYAKWLYKNKKVKKAILIYESVLNSTIYPDSVNIQKSLFWLGYYYRKLNLKKSNYYYTKSLEIDNTNKVAINSYYYLGDNLIKSNDFIKANEYYKSVISLLKNDKNNSLLLKSHYQIANNYYSKKNIKSLLKGLYHAKKADSLLSIIPTSKNNIYRFKMLLAAFYNENVTLNIPKSLKYYEEAKKIAQSLHDSDKINKINLSIGALYNTTNYKKFIKYTRCAFREC